jgi:hypothetical protein
MASARFWFIASFIVFLFCGCGASPTRMEQAEDPDGRYHDQIAVARRLLEQKETWADRAEWEVLQSGDGWRVVAWRVEHPERKGAERYLPWGYSEIELDNHMAAVHYHRKG